MRTKILMLALLSLSLAACDESYRDVPPNTIGMILAPSGYEGKVYSPGQVDIGEVKQGGQANSLVLIQSSGVEVKEVFGGKGTVKDDPNTDHRCMLFDKSPLTIDVRFLFALPDWSKPEGKKDLDRIFALGNPEPVQGIGRVSIISAEKIYADQARQQVRGRLRQICAGYADFDAIFKASADEGEAGLVKRVERAVADILKLKNVPLRLINAFPSNLKPDDSIIDAIAAKMAAQKRAEAAEVIVTYLKGDPTGTRRHVYDMQMLREISADGKSTVIFGPNIPLGTAVPLK